MRLLFLVFASTLATASASAQTARDTALVDSLFRANRHAITLKDGALAGPGADLLKEAARGTQFFMVGESHYVAEIPQFTAAWLATLRRHEGVRHFAIEYGPVIGDMLSAPGVRGNLGATLALGARYGHAFQFWNDEELESIARMNAPVWGLDNEWGALHALDRLVAIAPNAAARQVASALAEEARAVELARPLEMKELKRFISGGDSSSFDRLRDAFNPRTGSEAARLIDALEFSNRTYLLWGAPGTNYASNAGREAYMKQQFMRRYRAAQAAGETLPKVVLKFGSEHGGKWISRSNQHSLGNFVHEFALANGTRSFHVVAWLVDDPGVYWSLTDEPPYALLGRVGDPKAWYVVDLRPLRPLVHDGKVRALSPELRRAVFGYDAVLLIGNGKRGTYDALRAARH